MPSKNDPGALVVDEGEEINPFINSGKFCSVCVCVCVCLCVCVCVCVCTNVDVHILYTSCVLCLYSGAEHTVFVRCT